ncbi:PREDICTED: uncharacterized protein LOC108358465 [Rhagoletis zephyria]|uniref:uncharacterized protein LOC108358465 n=1 Tax=Rhagoletis zephyria TaxID=28612 RepID=UPI0008115C41|nr:PREDICTED: uncharacterized protein LOC108358465 [Rhagoletis zephyria]
MLPVADEVQLHVFVDASSSAYAAVAYLRICKGEDVDIAFVAAKSRCAPLKGMTIPRLELQAAVLGSRLQKSVVEYHDFNIHRIVLWSDSKTVLLWIRSTTREYKQFVAGRIAEIISSTNPLQWRWLPSSLNVADDATRGQPMTESDARNRWFKGPTFLQLPESEWPKEVTPLTSTGCAAEEKKILLLTSTTDEYVINFTKFSSFLKLLRVTSWVLRFNFNARNRIRRSGELKAFEITDSEVFVCCRVQEEVFPNELEELLSKQKVSKSSPLYQLTPFLDIDGLIKVNGRIDAAYCLPLSARRPIIMPQRHHVTSLLVSYWHKKLHHQNDCLTINQIRQKFWVPHIRAVLTSVKKRCSVCIINTAKPSAPMMGQLPVDRLTPYVRPFSYTGVDYCGPFFVTIGRRREKRWVALFTCLTVRAIHLEVAEDLSTDAFIICIRNFINRRGTPVRMRSDNGTNFVGAQKLLRVEERLFDFNRIEQDCAERGIEWIFNCPANPAAGGCWERLVQCVKRLLERVLKEEAPRLETFRSTLIEAENILNSRPLTDIPISHHDQEPLTPNHFLLGCLNSTQTPSLEEEKLCTRKQWRISQALKDRLWKRWTSEYLPSLICRPKWREQVKPLQPGQLVIVCEPNFPRSKWLKGRIKEVFAAKDGQVRSAIVQTSTGDLRRPAAKLAALNICESQ